MLVLISLPTTALLFLQNRQVQTFITKYFTEKVSEQLQSKITISSVNYSFFKRLQLYDFYLEDQKGDTLMYSEVTNVRFKKFRPDNKLIHIRKLSFENAYIKIKMDAERNGSIQFFVDSLKKDIPPEEKTVLMIDKIKFLDSRFRRLDSMYLYRGSGIDFRDLDFKDLNFESKDFLFKMDTTSFNIFNISGKEVSGFEVNNAELDLTLNPKFMSFNNAWLNTDYSKVAVPKIIFRYNDPRHFKYIYDSVYLHIESSNSQLQFSDISYFFPQVRNLAGSINLDGILYGKMGDLKGEKIIAEFSDMTTLHFDMLLRGLPEKDSLFMDFDFYEFSTTPSEFKSLTSNFNFTFLDDTTYFQGLDQLTYQGNFTGYSTNFETKGQINTNLGDVEIDLNMQSDTTKLLKFKGSVNSDGFKLGKMAAIESKLGSIDFNLFIDGVNDFGDIKANISGAVDTLGLYGYDYSNISIEGNFSNRKFDGSLYIRDPNIDLLFSGNIDLEKTIPSYEFTVDVSNLRPYYLNLRDDDPEYFASFFLKTNMTGRNFNELNGEVQLVNSFFRRTDGQLQLYDILLSTMNTPDSSFLLLESELLNAEVRGKYKIRELPGSIIAIMNDHFKVFPANTSSIDTLNSYTYIFDLKDVNPILDFFFPEFSLSKNITLEGAFRPENQAYTFSCNGFFPYFTYSNLNWEMLSISILADTSMLNLELESDVLSLNQDFEIIKPEIQAEFHNNLNSITINWDNDSIPKYAGNIRSNGSITYTESNEYIYNMLIEPSQIYYNNRKFVLPKSALNFNTTGISVDSFLIKGIDQYFLADGRYSQLPEDSIILKLSNINLHVINDLMTSFPLNFEGQLTGYTSFKSEFGKPMFNSDLHTKELEINEQYLGTTIIRANWMRTQEQLALDIFSESDSTNSVLIGGFYKPKSDKLDIDMKLSNINLKAFSPYLEGLMTELNGFGDISLGIDGSLKKPFINGDIKFRDGSFELSATRCAYNFTDNVRLYKNDIYFENFKFIDSYGNTLIADGNITTANLKNVFINMDFSAENFNFLSTTRFDNEQFYGNIYASANANLNGPLSNLRLNVAAYTEKNTNFKLPLYNAAQIQKSDFISFIKKEESVDYSPTIDTKRKNLLTLDMDLNISSNTTVQLIFDPKVGDIIEASGNGNLKLKLDEKGEFSMFGDVLIEDGQYLFTLQNVINKRFRVKPGGTISWNGPPISAIIDLEAVYETKASTYSLAPQPTEAMKKRIPVNCLLSLQGELSNPTIKPSLELPTAEPETKSLVETSIGTEEELMRQFISLLVINNFISNADFGLNPIGSGSSGVAGVTASELLSNQLSNWLSQISTDFDIGVNYRPGDNISSDEVEVALSTQLLNDRIIFSGNLDVLGDQVTTPSGEASNIVGDFDLEFRLSDKISLTAFNQVNDDRVVRPSLYTQGVGIQYRSEFNKIADIFRKDETKKERRKKRRQRDENAILNEEN